ncbi:MAG: HAD-IC family P-type ATPase [Gammaproteobacteria bacterium]|nr:HAD-IC family P-type ATPase [Gammaproteobacteria bacterium]
MSPISDVPPAASNGRVNDARRGLTTAEARERLARYGPNVLPSEPAPSALAIFVRQLKSPLIYVLLAAAAVALLMGDFTDAAFIGVVLLVNSALGGWQEWRAERQSRSLQELLRIRATVLRDGVTVEIDAEQLVPGDIVSLESGQRVPADLRLLDAHALEVDEALLTGESVPVEKDPGWTGSPELPPSERRDMLFAGTTVVRGRADAEVVATGATTVVGGLALTMSATEGGQPPLVARMERFARVVAVVVLVAAVVIGVVGVVVRGESIGAMFLFGVALAVSAIPEGLPVALTVTLAIAARRMASRGAIVRSLPAVEGLGSCTLIASDKTGTLTCNELTVRELRFPDGTACEVTGAGYVPVGEILPRGPAAGEKAGPALRRLLEVAVACNEADLVRQDGRWSSRGDPTDIALLALAGKGGVDRHAVLLEWPEVGGVPFEPEQRFAASLHARDGGTWLAVKGAPERVLAMCRLSGDEAIRLLHAAEEMGGRGLRVLALACGRRPGVFRKGDPPPELSGLEFAGLAGLIDPLRPGARDAVERCGGAGIRVIMVTGDHPVTALAIARDLGIASRPDEVVAGSALATGRPDRLRDAIRRARVFARVTPGQKLAIVEAAQADGQFVAVTGDGVNDAPALRRGNIGVAMGKGGTDVAREAADLVLSDDNFATIVNGIEEGRIAYQNIRNVVYLLIAAGVAEVLTVGLAVVAGLPLPLLPVQLLWLNLVTNGIQDVGLAFERGHGDELDAPPRRPGEPLIDRLMIERGLTAGLWMSALGIGWFAALVQAGVPLAHARNELLLLMVLMQNVDAFNARSETRSIFRIPAGNNPLLVVGVLAALLLHVAAMYFPPLQSVLSVAPLTAREWLVMPLMALSLLALMELHKVSWALRHRRASSSGRG